jgi:hypothetical protein
MMMRRRIALLGIAGAVAIGACTLNPQPLPPDQPGDGGLYNGAPGSSDAATPTAYADASHKSDDAATDAPAVTAPPDGAIGADDAGGATPDGSSDGEADASSDADMGDAMSTAD